MSWDFDDVLKGQVAQAVLQSVLERVGYQVRRFGVEELHPNLRGNEESLIRKGLSERLRFLPDLLVVDPESGQVHLTEVKFRRAVSDTVLQSLVHDLTQRRRCWPEMETVVMIAEAHYDRGFHQDHIRVILPGIGQELETTDRSPRERWERLPPLQKVYRRLFDSVDRQQIADSVTGLLRDLAKIQRPMTAEEIRRRAAEWLEMEAGPDEHRSP